MKIDKLETPTYLDCEDREAVLVLLDGEYYHHEPIENSDDVQRLIHRKSMLEENGREAIQSVVSMDTAYFYKDKPIVTIDSRNRIHIQLSNGELIGCVFFCSPSQSELARKIKYSLDVSGQNWRETLRNIRTVYRMSEIQDD